ncbi:hypothetical protein MCEET85_00874 [Candidatus Methylopumilus planktonicus]|uniref:hypothetical protein n=1 Tax=Candidatus Methylopumilus planktonicus TaxID=1581557 RepID=UPI003BEECE94
MNKKEISFTLKLLKTIKHIPFALKIVRKIYPSHIQNILKNFRTLAFGYNQLGSMKKWSCLDKNNNPIPWYTYPTIEYLENLDFSDKNIFEYGSGNSSLWWVQRCKKIISIESDKKWFKYIQKIKNSNLDYRFSNNKKNYIYQSDIAGSHVIIIDGLWRSECADFVITSINSNKINPNMLIFDNSDWYPKTISKLNKRLKHYVQVDFSGFGPINGYTWTTSVFINSQFDSKLIYKTKLKSIAGIKQFRD